MRAYSKFINLSNAAITDDVQRDFESIIENDSRIKAIEKLDNNKYNIEFVSFFNTGGDQLKGLKSLCNVSMQRICCELTQLVFESDHFITLRELRAAREEIAQKNERIAELEASIALSEKCESFYIKKSNNMEKEKSIQSVLNKNNKLSVKDFIMRRLKRNARSNMTRKEFLTLSGKTLDLFINNYTWLNLPGRAS